MENARGILGDWLIELNWLAELGSWEELAASITETLR